MYAQPYDHVPMTYTDVNSCSAEKDSLGSWNGDTIKKLIAVKLVVQKEY